MLNVYFSDDRGEMIRFTDFILGNDPVVVGFDTETRQAGKGVDIIQICYKRIEQIHDKYPVEPNMIIDIDDKYDYDVFVFSLIEEFVIFKKLSKILTSKHIIKVGCDIVTDANRIKNTYKINMDGIIDTQYIVKSFGGKKFSLDYLANYHMNDGKRSKNNWIHQWSIISDNILEYSAYDAYLSLITYEKSINIQDYTDLTMDKIYDSEINDIINFIGELSNMDDKYKISNILINSYKPWNEKYSKNQIKYRILLVLKKIEQIEQKDQKIVKKEINNNESYIINVLSNTMNIKGMKKSSIINYINNSTQYDINKINVIIDNLINRHILISIGNKYIFNTNNSNNSNNSNNTNNANTNNANTNNANTNKANTNKANTNKANTNKESDVDIVMIKIKKAMPHTGLKYNSMFNLLFNSTWKELDQKQKSEKIINILDQIIKNKKIVNIQNKYHLNI